MMLNTNRILVATELPIKNQNVLASLTDYDFVIAPICKKYPEYLSFNIAQRLKGRFVVLDNGAFEGELMDTDELIALAKEIHPQEIVAPDVIGDRKATIEHTKEFVEKFHEADLGNIQIQVAPQGGSFDEWADCYRELANLPSVSTLGLSYVGHFQNPEDGNWFGSNIVAQEATRLRFLYYLIGSRLLRSDKAHHLLGLYSPAALRQYSRYPFLRSMDSSFPIICAQHRTEMDVDVQKFSTKLNYLAELKDDEMRLAIQNILWVKKECQR